MIVSVATPEVTTTPSTLEKRRNSDSLLPSQAESLKDGFKQVEEQHRRDLKKLERRYKSAVKQLQLKHRVCKVLKAKNTGGVSKEEEK
ncbi:hypothetical protein GAYE_SCF24G4406 [Galdieria yellowstonensis]|jgi:hypothetical protein|uniref:Uncharacterized protein n=1 Tax=Galdieria yellowstonensis TaxID=3028027 RepID=A0AAV9IGK7_9RHOD|nr:hypothetical protein GAYE_SCF24G4406 [Galdieria yellowstonensis]